MLLSVKHELLSELRKQMEVTLVYNFLMYYFFSYNLEAYSSLSSKLYRDY